MTDVLTLRAVGVRFQLGRSKRMLTPALARVTRHVEENWGLRGLDLTVAAGESVALIGDSGSGKSTLLRVIAGVMPTDEGAAVVTGRVGSLLSVQAGVLGGLTGAENALLLAVLSGMTRREARGAIGWIRDRSALGPAFERPVSTYSQGMRARLGFAVADCARPDILLLDEVHEALDETFREVVEQRAHEICESGGVVVACGHDHALLRRICSRTVELRDGAIRG